MLCDAEKMHITGKEYTTDHKTIHIQYTVFPEIPMMAQLIKIFTRILWNLQIIMEFYETVIRRSPEARIVKIHPDTVP
jgi:hypothetical protein